MDPHPPRGRTVSLAGIVTLGALVAYVFAPSAVRPLTVAVMLVGSVACLHSCADEPAAFPLGGVGVLLLSVVGLATSAVLLWSA